MKHFLGFQSKNLCRKDYKPFTLTSASSWVVREKTVEDTTIKTQEISPMFHFLFHFHSWNWKSTAISPKSQKAEKKRNNFLHFFSYAARLSRMEHKQFSWAAFSYATLDRLRLWLVLGEIKWEGKGKELETETESESDVR